MIKNLLLLSIAITLFTGCGGLGTVLGINQAWASNQDDIKAEYLALNQQQKEAYLEFIKDDCLREQEIIELKKEWNRPQDKKFVDSLINKHYQKGERNKYVNLDKLEGLKGDYWNYGHFKEEKQDRARAVRTCHNLFFEQNNIKHTSKIEK